MGNKYNACRFPKKEINMVEGITINFDDINMSIVVYEVNIDESNTIE